MLSVEVSVGELAVELDLLSELLEEAAPLCELSEDVVEADELELLCELSEDVVEADELELPSEPSEVVELLHPAKVNIITALKIPANNFFMSKSPLQIY